MLTVRLTKVILV